MVIAPLASRTRAGMELRSTAFDIASSMRNARAAAQTSNAEQALVIDVGSRLLWTEGQAVGRPLPRRFGMTLDLPVTERVSANAGRMRFFPDGSASGGKVVLREGGRVGNGVRQLVERRCPGAVDAIGWRAGSAASAASR